MHERNARPKPERATQASNADDGQTEDDVSWFDDPAWQAGERAVDEHLKAGRVATYDCVDDLLRDLHRDAAD